MKVRILGAVVVAAVLAFGWGAVAWPIGSFYMGWAFKPMPQPEQVASHLEPLIQEDGAYFYPPMPETKAGDAATADLVRQSWRAQTEKGPIMLLLVRQHGFDPDDITLVLRGFVLDFFTAAIVAGIMAIACKFGVHTPDRIALAIFLAFFAVLAGGGTMWNFFHLPDNYALAVAIDTFVSWLLAGVACAVIIRPRQRSARA